MTQEHPITPPPELVHKWIMEATEPSYVPTQAARWGADQELEACCEWLVADDRKNVSKHLRAARRPKPPSLKETMLARVARIPGEGADTAYLHHWLENESQQLVDALHKAINSLPD